MTQDMKDLIDKELNSIVISLVSEGIINAKFDDKGCPSDISFTEEGKAFMEVVAFNLSHRISKIIESDDIDINEKQDLKSILKGIDINQKQDLKSILKKMKNLPLP